MKKKKQTFLLLISIIVLASLMTYGHNAYAASKVKLNYTQRAITRLDHFKLKVQGDKRKAKWTTSNKDVAIVKKNGMVYGRGKGTCKITAKVGGKKYVCNVTVKDVYGTLSGNISYHYNEYKGYVPDTGATICAIDVLSSKVMGTATADGNGDYTIPHLPIGLYIVVISSSECKSTDVLYGNEVNDFYKEYGVYLHVAGTIEYKYEVQIYKNETTTISHAFPYSDY